MHNNYHQHTWSYVDLGPDIDRFYFTNRHLLPGFGCISGCVLLFEKVKVKIPLVSLELSIKLKDYKIIWLCITVLLILYCTIYSMVLL